ncbi:uncharacterized protein YbjT (DUF2867 family) [Motilibacter rhizosphaerae]|uniref:Uncharacterized protein YbjT (DUF2867 family) n=1 Tax=Motilibacter rhizosphaerae TaxID=598652 RepID=A0A4Q7NVT6_9ACTN|nr:NAD(P)H-binding protein [Motilibacter rhizosphaerae]RZS91100.1 uncharacterized protein YbjT (DUF2867 family) [Motilibacter rhizosphaerae]
MVQRVAVIGGTGLLGRLVVAELDRRGTPAVPVSRATGADLLTGRGLDAALEGCDAVVDASSTGATRRSSAVRFFDTAADHLLAAEQRAGVAHHVLVTIVGADRVPFGYYQGKQQQERRALRGPVPATVLRTTQWHEFAQQLLDRTPGPLALVPRMRVQPVAAAEVAARVVDLLEARPSAEVPDLAGPEVHELPHLARRLLATRGSRRRVVPVRLPGAVGRGFAGGGLLPGPEAELGRATFQEWLAARES